MRFIVSGIVLSIFVLLSCNDEKTERKQLSYQGNPAVEMERVFRKWQDHLDRNEFAEVRQLSTSSTESLISMLEDLVAMMPEDSTIMHVEFKEVRCVQKSDTLGMCYYSIEEEEPLTWPGEDALPGEEEKTEPVLYRDSIELRLRNGHWLVHSPLVLNAEDIDLLEDLFESDVFGESPEE